MNLNDKEVQLIIKALCDTNAVMITLRHEQSQIKTGYAGQRYFNFDDHKFTIHNMKTENNMTELCKLGWTIIHIIPDRGKWETIAVSPEGDVTYDKTGNLFKK